MRSTTPAFAALQYSLALAASTLLLASFGCKGSDASILNNFAKNNSSGPRITVVEFIDVDGNDVDEGDVLVFTFDGVVRIVSTFANAFAFNLDTESFGTGATLSQTVPGSTRIELVLGTDPNIEPDVTRLNIKSSGTINIGDHFGDDARPSVNAIIIADETTTSPVLVRATSNDSDNNGSDNTGDTILCEFSKPIEIPAGQTVAGNFALPVTGDSLGASPGMTAFSNAATNRGILLTVDASPVITTSGIFSAATTTAGSPSGVAMSATPGIRDTTSTGNAVTASTQVDIDTQGSTPFFLGQPGSTFPGNIDSSTPDVGGNGFYSPQGVFHFEGSVTVGANTFTGIDLFFVADSQNNRVLVYSDRPTGNNATAFAVLGQADLFQNLPNRSSATTPGALAGTMWSPTDVHFNAATNQLFVSDTNNHRVLVFNDVIDGSTGLYDLPDGVDADIVLGHDDFVSREANDGNATPDSRTLSSPAGLHVAGGQLAVADAGNHRTLIWSSIPSGSNAAASTVLGQSSFGSGLENAGTTAGAATMSAPFDVFLGPTVAMNGGTGFVAVADTGNHRVLVFLSASPATGASADRVLGQTVFTTTAANQGGAAAAGTLNAPSGVAARANAIYVADTDNHRALYYDGATLTSGEAAAAAIGQSALTGASQNAGGAPAASTLAFPTAVHVSDATSQRFFVADTANHRVLDFATVPTTTNPSADLEQGQPSFVTSDAKGHVLNHPTAIAFTAGKMIVADKLNNRVLIYNTTPTVGNAAPSVAIGQANLFDTLPNQGGSAGAATLFEPEGVATDGTRLVIADSGNNRVLIFNTIPTSSGTAANVVVGQPALTANTANTGGLSGATMDSPVAVEIASGGQLLVADRDNHRVLVYDDITTLTVNGIAADAVIGQASFTANLPNRGDFVRAGHLFRPSGLLEHAGRLYIADRGNHRVVVFGVVPSANDVDADFVLGQPNLTSAEPNAGTTRMNGPTALATDGARLIVADSGNHRLMVFNTIPTDTGTGLSVVLGQASFSANAANRGASTPATDTLAEPRGVFFNGQDLWTADMKNSRLVRIR